MTMQDQINHLEFHADSFFMRPWQIDDAKSYVECRDEEIFIWTLENRELTIEEAKRGIEKHQFNTNYITRAIIDKDDMSLIGNIGLKIDTKTRRSAEIIYWLAPAGRGKGIASEAVKILCKWAFDSLGFEKITLKTHVRNNRSKLVAERAGFKRILTDSTIAADTNDIWFELIKRE